MDEWKSDRHHLELKAHYKAHYKASKIMSAASAVQCLVPGHYDSRQSEPGFEPATFRSIEDPLYHLGCSLSTKSDNSHRHIFCILCEEWQILLHLTEELWPAQRTEMYQYVSIILPPRWAKHCVHEPHNTHWIKAKKVLTVFFVTFYLIVYVKMFLYTRILWSAILLYIL